MKDLLGKEKRKGRERGNLHILTQPTDDNRHKDELYTRLSYTGVYGYIQVYKYTGIYRYMHMYTVTYMYRSVYGYTGIYGYIHV